MTSKKFELDHIGIVVKDLEKAFEFYKTLGWEKMDVDEVPTEQVRVGFIPFENQVNVELLEPTSEESVIAKFLDKRGGGVHHICYRVNDIKSVVEDLKAKGIRIVGEAPRPGAHGCQVAFIHPAEAGGVLVELSQPPEE